MKKSICLFAEPRSSKQSGGWLNLSEIADVELTSEQPEHPVESLFFAENAGGWKAADGGTQTIRLRFHRAQSLSQVYLEFQEDSVERTQEFALEYQLENERQFRTIVRQRWSFSPRGSTTEIEDYKVELIRVSAVQLTISADIQNRQALATLAKWQMR